MNFLCALLFSMPAFAAPLILQPVGEYGGIRVRVPCRLETEWRDCAVDTGGPVTMTHPSLLTRPYEKIREVTMHSVGMSVTCDLLKVPGTDFAGSVATREVLSCAEFFESISPTLAMDSFAHRSFAFDFGRKEFSWDISLPAGAAAVERERHWLILPARVGKEAVRAGFDTGAPVTLVDQKFVDAHPALFRLSPIAPSEMLIRRHFVAYELLAPIEVGGVELTAPLVHAGDFAALKVDFPIILGANHLSPHRWGFDLARGLWAVDFGR
jgi:hypothetical protein